MIKEMNKDSSVHLRKRMYEIGYNDAVDDIENILKKKGLLTDRQIKILIIKLHKLKKDYYNDFLKKKVKI